MSDAPEARTGPKMGRLAALIAVQVVLALVLGLAEAGFDKPGALGLDFGGVLLLAAAFCVAWGAGQVLAVRRRAWMAVGLQCLVLVGAVAAFSAGEQAPIPRFDPAAYQNLVGASRADVEREIGSPRGSTDYTERRPGGDRRELRLAGMTVVFGPGDVVVSVTPNER